MKTSRRQLKKKKKEFKFQEKYQGQVMGLGTSTQCHRTGPRRPVLLSGLALI